MGRFIDLSGMRFGRLVAIERGETVKHGEAVKWVCKCDCGNTLMVSGNSLRSGNTTSCGCYKIELCVEKCHKLTKHGLSRERLHRIWYSMLDRCTNPQSKRYEDYGGKGIVVCEEWKSDYLKFRKWALSNGYSDDLTIDRIDNNAGYYPENCRWATYKEQCNNRRNNRVLTYNGESHNLIWWAEKYGISKGTLAARLNRDWDIERALTQKPK